MTTRRRAEPGARVAPDSAADLGVAHSWGSGPEVVFPSSPLADPVSWSTYVRSKLLDLGYCVSNPSPSSVGHWAQPSPKRSPSQRKNGCNVRLALGLLTGFPPERLADDAFVHHMRTIRTDFAGIPTHENRTRASTFISTYQGRLPFLEHIAVPCLVMGFELDVDTCAARAREVAEAIPNAEYREIPGVAHAAPLSDPESVWPPVIDFLQRHHPAPRR